MIKESIDKAGLSYDELMMLTQGHGTSPIYERVLTLMAMLQAELEGVRTRLCDSERENKLFQQERDEARSDRNNAVIDLYRKLDNKDLAIAETKQQLAEATNHAASLSNDVTHLGEQLAAREVQYNDLIMKGLFKSRWVREDHM